MKTIKKLSILLLIVTFVVGCENNNTDEVINYPEAIIIKKLPKMYIRGNIELREQKVIQTKIELLKLFNQTEIDRFADLQNIDFTKQTLLIGCGGYYNQANVDYIFSKKSENEYVLSVNITGDATAPAPNFQYGIIVKKLPKTAVVTFTIVKH